MLRVLAVLGLLLPQLLATNEFPKGAAKGAILASLSVPTTTKLRQWRACADLWNMAQAEIAVHLEAGEPSALVKLPGRKTTESTLHFCRVFENQREGAPVRLMLDNDVRVKFNANLELVEVAPEGT